MEELSGVILIGFVLAVGAVTSLWSTRKVELRAEPRFEAAAVDELPEAATKAMAEAVESLTPAGFVVEANVLLPRMERDQDLLLMAFVHRPTQTLALVTLGLKRGDVSKMLSVQSRLADGTLIETNNDDPDLPLPGVAGVKPLVITRKLDHVHPIDPADFVAIHACRVKGEVAPLPADMVHYLQERHRTHTQWLLASGYFKQRGEWLRLTLKGRLMIALRSNFFAAQFRNIRRELATDRVLKRWRTGIAV